MKKHFKIKSIAMICALAIAGIFGISSAVINNKNESNFGGEKTNAASTIDIYCTQAVTRYQGGIKVYRFDDAWETFTTMTPVFQNEHNQQVYKATINTTSGILFLTYDQNSSRIQSVDIKSGLVNNAGWYTKDEWTDGKFQVGTWTAYPYTINYYGNGSTSGSMSSSTGYGNVQWGLAANSFVRTGYTFAGWNTEANGSGSSYADEGLLPTKTNTTAVNLYAQWTAKTSALTFNANGGSGTMPTGKTATYGSTMPAYGQSAPTRDGYRFEGYYDTSAASGGTQYYTSALASARTWNKDTTSGTTLYARWTELLDLTFYLDASNVDFESGTPWFGYNESGDVPTGDAGHWTAMSRVSHSYAGNTLNYWTITISDIYVTGSLKLRINNTTVGWDTGSFTYNSDYNTFWSSSSGGTPVMYSGNGSVHKISLYKKLPNTDPVIFGEPSYLLDGINYQIPAHTSLPGYDWDKWYSNATGSGGDTYDDYEYVAFHSSSSVYAIYKAYEYDTNDIFWLPGTNGLDCIYAWIPNGEKYENPAQCGTISIGGVEYYHSGVNARFTKVLFTDDTSFTHKTADLTIADGIGKYYDPSTSSWKNFSIPIEYKLKGGSDYDGTDAASRAKTYTYTSTFNVPDGVKPGYTIKSWHTLPDCSDSAITSLAAYEFTNTKIILYGEWESGEEAAIEFATNFNSAIGSICTSYNTNTKSSFLTNWNGTQEAAYNALEDYQLYWLVVGRSSNEEIIEMIGNNSTIRGKYDYVLSKYGYGIGASNLHDFMGRTPSKSAISSFTPYVLFGSEDGMSTVIIIISSSIALLSITALSILVIKKRKSKEQE